MRHNCVLLPHMMPLLPSVMRQVGIFFSVESMHVLFNTSDSSQLTKKAHFEAVFL